MTEGEAWAREVLGELRAARFTPAAWVRFLGASFRRSGDDARRRPDLAREAWVWGVAGALVWAGCALLEPRASWGLAWWALVAAMVWWHLGMVEGLEGEARGSLGVASGLTLARAWLVPALPLVAVEPWAFAVVFAAGGLADVLDGRVARAREEVTRFGSQTDGAVDMAFALSAAWTAAAAGWLPTWAALLVSARYIAPPLLIAGFYFARAAPPARDAFVPGRLPGLVVAVGLCLVALEPVRGAAAALIVLGTVGGLATATISIRNVTRSGGVG